MLTFFFDYLIVLLKINSFVDQQNDVHDILSEN